MIFEHWVRYFIVGSHIVSDSVIRVPGDRVRLEGESIMHKNKDEEMNTHMAGRSVSKRLNVHEFVKMTRDETEGKL